MDGWRAPHANHHHRHATDAGTAATMRAERIRGRCVADISAVSRFVAPARHAVCAALPLFAQRYARYKNALPKAHLDVLDGANERSTEHESRRVDRQGVGNSGGPIGM
jgi:hypothetical protein